MNSKKKKVLIVLAVIAIIFIAAIISQTRIFKPSFGSRVARLTVKLYLAPAFTSKDFVHNVRNRLENISKLALLPPGTKVEEVSIGNMKADWISANGVDPKGKKAILYIHGGGFLAGSRNTHREMVARISKASGLPVLVPEYRLAPENKFPAALDDCLAAYRWLLKQGYQPRNIAIGGDSAGGCLTLMTLISLRDAGTGLPGAAFLLSPLTDAVNYDGETIQTKAGIDPWFDPKDIPKHLGLFSDNFKIMSPLLSPVRMNLGETIQTKAGIDPWFDPKDIPKHLGLFSDNFKIMSPLLSPVRMNLAGLPPILIHVGTDEILLSDSTRLAERAKKAGVDTTIHVWDGMWHVFQSFAVIIPEARDAIDEIGEFLKKRI